MSAHDLHDKCTLMRIGRTDDGIDGLNDAMKCRVGTDGHVSSTEICRKSGEICEVNIEQE